MDPDIVKQLNNGVAVGTQSFNAIIQQHASIIAIAAQYDMRLLNGFLASQLFNLNLVEAKAAYHTPVEPGAAPLATPPSK